MSIVEVSTGRKHSIVVLRVESSDYKHLTQSRYFFNWKQEKNEEVYKLLLKESNEVLGLISIERIQEEWRIHIRLLTVSKENKGKKKKFSGIAGNLIAHVAKIAVAEFGELACVSLKPKTSIMQHYIDTYNMNRTGVTLSIEVPEILDLINQFENDERV